MDHSEHSGHPGALNDVFTSQRQDPPPTKAARIRFPISDSSPRRYDGDAFSGSPSRRGSPLNPDWTTSSADGRRRARPMDTSNGTREQSPSQLLQDSIELEGVFSNEYDLYPRILHDVQRALKMKARREARLKKTKVEVLTESSSSTSPFSISSPKSSHQASSVPPPSSPTHRKAGTSTSSDTSPRPSMNAIVAFSSHPIPHSMDNGMTLDWGAYSSDDDKYQRRWTLSSKRKDKDMLPLEATVELQEKMHKEKLKRIKTVATPQTIKKAAVARDQLERRYRLLYRSMSPNPVPINLLTVSRWYRSLEELLRHALETAEPFTWLRHLEKKSAKTKLHWHLSALIMEEYLQATKSRDFMQTIPENHPLFGTPAGQLEAQMHKLNLDSLYPAHKPSNSNTRIERLLSLEPQSRKSIESGLSSVNTSVSSAQGIVPLSPRTSRLDAPQMVSPLYERLGNGSNLSSPRTSSSELSDALKANDDEHHSFNTNQNVDDTNPIIGQEATHPTSQVNTLPLQLEAFGSGKSNNITRPSSIERSSAPHSLASVNRAIGRRRVRVSLPSGDRSSQYSTGHRELEEEHERRNYENKALLLEEATMHNHQVRQLLNRISITVREHELAQSKTMRSLGKSRTGLPRELLDAFGFDPAAVTGATRRLKGWRAVEDIHGRLLLQRQTFHAFLSGDDHRQPGFSSVLKGPISTLLRSLENLDQQKTSISIRANEVVSLSNTVQTVHASVKADYNSTLSRTSVVYPELSQIVALEESYRDQYQQIWEFGMDALTFLLDTVTPVWRTYGKRIGEDVRDFLIIPLYRNEFTGEAKRYGITEIPKRSFRHWLGLVLFFLSSIFINILQVRAAITSSLHFRLQWVPYDGIRWTALPFFWVGILMQWVAVIVELSIVTMQIGVVAWWVGWSVKIFT